MLAALGYVTPEITGKLPGYLSPSMGLMFAQIFVSGGFCELSGVNTPAASTSEHAGIPPGGYGFKVLTSDDPAELPQQLLAETVHGRLAVMASSACSFQMDSQGPQGARVLYTASPLRTFENELGVQDPVGDLLAFQRRCCVELNTAGSPCWPPWATSLQRSPAGWLTSELQGF